MIARGIAIALCALAAAAAWPLDADAGVYAFRVCDDPGGAGANHAFTGSVYGRGVVRGCTPGEGLHTEANRSGGGPLYYPEGGFLEFCPPAGARIVRYQVSAYTFWAGSGFARRMDGGPCGGYRYLEGGIYAPSFGEGHLAVFDANTDVGGLRLSTFCEWSPCDGNLAGTNWHNIKVALSDAGGPSVHDLTGSAWTTGGWLRGDHTLAWGASDSTGIRYLHAQVVAPGGAVAQSWNALDNSTGACGPLSGWDYNGTWIPLYDRPVPCPPSDRASTTVRTAGVADGQWNLEALAMDSAGNWAGRSRTVNVDNTAPTATLERGAGSYAPAVTWKVADARSGVDGGSLAAAYSTDGGGTWQAMEGGSWNAATGTFVATVPSAAGDGAVHVRLTGADNAKPGGNGFSGAAAAIRVDTRGPSVTLRGAGSPGVPHPGPVTVTLTARDALAGMGAAPENEPVDQGAHVAYALDGGDWTLVRGDEARIPIAGVGDHALGWYAVDAARNRSVRQTRAITIRPGTSRDAGLPAGFSDTSANPRTTFTAALRFGDPCPAEATVAADRDGAVGERETFVGFPLPAAPDCTVESARLRLYATAVVAGRPVDVTRASAAWDEPSLTAASRPGVVGPASRATSPAAPGWIEWDVTEQVRALYRIGDNGLVLRDAAAPGGGTVVFCAREAVAADCADRAPQLVARYSG